VAREEPHVSVGGLLEAGQRRKKGDFGKEFMHKENDSWKEEKHARMHGIPNDVGLGLLQCIVMDEDPKTYK
jgi:hypothetical protein